MEGSPFSFFNFYFVLLFKNRFFYIAQIPLELLILLPQFPKCWIYRHDTMCGRKATFKQSAKDSKLCIHEEHKGGKMAVPRSRYRFSGAFSSSLECGT